MKSTSGLIRHMDAYTSQIIQQGLPIYIQLEQDIQIPGEDDNVSKYFRPYKDMEYTLDEQDIKSNHRDLVDESSELESRSRDSLSGRTP